MEKKRKVTDDSLRKEEVVTCTVCLEDLTCNLNDTRTLVKLQCAHQFHLDCIGSAFNSKRAMQCPNCRGFERGKWRSANGGRPLREFNIDDLASHEDVFYLTHSELAEMTSTISELRRDNEQLQKNQEKLTEIWDRLEKQLKNVQEVLDVRIASLVGTQSNP